MVEIAVLPSSEVTEAESVEDQHLRSRLKQLWGDKSLNNLYFRMRVGQVFELGDDVSFENFVKAMKEELRKDSLLQSTTQPAEDT